MQKEAFDYLSRLLKWRKGSKAVASGKLIHYVPENGVYVYARYTDKERVVVILNNGDKVYNLNIERYTEAFVCERLEIIRSKVYFKLSGK